MVGDGGELGTGMSGTMGTTDPKVKQNFQAHKVALQVPYLHINKAPPPLSKPVFKEPSSPDPKDDDKTTDGGAETAGGGNKRGWIQGTPPAAKRMKTATEEEEDTSPQAALQKPPPAILLNSSPTDPFKLLSSLSSLKLAIPSKSQMTRAIVDKPSAVAEDISLDSAGDACTRNEGGRILRNRSCTTQPVEPTYFAKELRSSQRALPVSVLKTKKACPVVEVTQPFLPASSSSATPQKKISKAAVSTEDLFQKHAKKGRDNKMEIPLETLKASEIEALMNQYQNSLKDLGPMNDPVLTSSYTKRRTESTTRSIASDQKEIKRENEETSPAEHLFNAEASNLDDDDDDKLNPGKTRSKRRPILSKLSKSRKLQNRKDVFGNKSYKFICYGCKLEFKEVDGRAQFKAHFKNHHMKGKKFICPHCRGTFTMYNNLNSHMRAQHCTKNHMNGNMYICSLCSGTFTLQGNLNRHMRTRHPLELGNKKSYRDVLDEQGFKTELDTVHVKSRSGYFEARDSKRRRILSKSNIMSSKSMGLLQDGKEGCPKKKYKYMCYGCNLEFKAADRALLSRHFRNHHMKGNKYICNFCPNVYTLHNSLNRHMKSKHSVKEETADGESDGSADADELHSKASNFEKAGRGAIESKPTPIPSRSNLNSTKSSGLKIDKSESQIKKGRKFMCHGCNLEFKEADRKLLSVHFRKNHMKGDKYICNICSNLYTLRSSFNRHMQTKHVNRKENRVKNEKDAGEDQKLPQKYKCNICGELMKRCQQVIFLHHETHKTSQKTKQNSPKSPSTGIKGFECTICHDRFDDVDGLRQHLVIHLNERGYPCKFRGCGITLTTKSNLQRHAAMHVLKNPFACEVCPGTMFRRQGDLTKHNNAHHSSHSTFRGKQLQKKKVQLNKSSSSSAGSSIIQKVTIKKKRLLSESFSDRTDTELRSNYGQKTQDIIIIKEERRSPSPADNSFTD